MKLPTVTPARQFGFYGLDIASGRSTWSPELRRMLSVSPSADMSKQSLRDWVYREDQAIFDSAVAQALLAPGPIAIKFRVALSDGSKHWVQCLGESQADTEGGKVTRLTGALSDITSVMETAVANLAAQDAFWRMIDPAPFGVYAVDADFKIVRLSEGGRATFEGIDNVIGRDLGEVLRILWPESFASEAIAHFRHTLETGESYRAPPVIELRSDRRVVEAYDWGIDQMRLADGRMGVICHYYDLSERVRAETELKERQQRLNFAYDAARMGAWETDLSTGKTVWTEQLVQMFGAAEGDPADIWTKMVVPEDQVLVSEAFEKAINGGPQFDIDFRMTLPDGEVRYLGSKGEVIHGANGAPERMIGVNFDITNRKMAEMAFRDSERQLRVVIDNLVAFVGVLNPQGILKEANETALAAGGLTRAETVGKPFWETYWWSHDDEVAARLKQAVQSARDGDIVRYDAVVRMANDQLVTIEFMLAPVLGDDGNVTMLVASGFDISEREVARAHVHSLMGEINHRSKNILTLVQILARQSARGGAADFVERFEKRIRALANAQDLLIHSSTDRVDLRDLMRSQIGHFQELVGERILVSGPMVELAPHAAQAIGMALHELSTNAGKYGALSNDRGVVDLTWSVDLDAAEGGMFYLQWRERGGPTVAPPKRKGFGSTVIRTMTESSLHGEVALDLKPDGLEWSLACPVKNLTVPT